MSERFLYYWSKIYAASLKEGIKEGRETGIEEGTREAKLSIANKLLEKGYSLEEIAEITELEVKNISTLSFQKREHRLRALH